MLRSFNSNGYKVYALSAGKPTPQFHVSKKNKKKSKGDAEYENRIDLIHDLEFPQACNTVDISPDLQYIVATGVYPPQIGIYDTSELSLKHRRGIDSEVLKTCFLESDYTKLAFLCEGRVIEFHDRGGRYHSIRIPKEGRDMKYLSDNASIFTVASCNEVYRLNLEQGVFETPLKSVCSYLNCIAENPVLPVVSAGGEGGILESWDLRCEKSLAQLQCTKDDSEVSVTFCAYTANGMKVAVGTESGCLQLYDVRNTKPLWEKRHVNEAPVKNIEWVSSLNHASTGVGQDALIAWSDHKSVRVQNAHDGEFVASIEGLVVDKANNVGKINSFRFYPDTGICFVVGDHTRIGTYFIPTVGAAPKWCSFLENITEEMEMPSGSSVGADGTKQAYDDFVFVTRQQLEELNAADLIGTNMVKDYMHGYFIDSDVHRELKNAASNFDYEAYRKQKIQEKIDAKRQMRLPLRKKKTTAVNEELAEQLRTKASAAGKKALTKKQREQALHAKAVLQDDRFARIFTDENFAIDRVDATEISKKRKYLDT
ncbi:Nucleolar protein 10 [Babesia sp. Xinjiang]|uniref:Nucleolar protein 10 n=1 Tax=Babesia sp. Xinjiang TaxID=462227 RepID=UPI000A25FCB1|nr:Nucleolar protein 10 [Babesia sp. Xinjiang]ORM40709.1 Nucleolar protein 10 [Babesia sp. Xinjiang]